MPRMPMIAATPLLLPLLLLLLFSPAWAKPAVRLNSRREPYLIPTESTPSFEAGTVTVDVDPDIILTTEDSEELFTQLADHSGTTTEEPLPESVLLQLEQEREEREKKEREKKQREEAALLTTEEPTKELKKDNATTKATSGKTTMSWFTTTPKPTEATLVKSVASLVEDAMGLTDEVAEHENNHNTFNPINNNINPVALEEDLEMGDSQTDSAVETTTYLPQGDEFTTQNNNRYEPMTTEKPELTGEVPSTLAPMKESFQLTSRPFMSELSEFSMLKQTTWLPDLALLVESTVQPEFIMRATELGDKALPVSTTTEAPGDITTIAAVEKFAETTMEVPKAIKMIENITTSTTEQPTTEQPTTEQPTTEQPTTEQTTTEQTTTTSAVTEATTLPVTTTEVQQTTTSTTSTTTEATTVTVPVQEETTVASPKQQVLLEAIATTARPVEITTTEAPLPTTQQARVPSTRAPRVERIFNPDGVEVLYGYSSVVRTNRA